MINVDCNVCFMKEWKIKGSLDFGSQGLLRKKVFFCDFWLFACFCFLNND